MEVAAPKVQGEQGGNRGGALKTFWNLLHFSLKNCPKGQVIRRREDANEKWGPATRPSKTYGLSKGRSEKERKSQAEGGRGAYLSVKGKATECWNPPPHITLYGEMGMGHRGEK